MGKGDKRRPSKISHEEELLRWKLAFRSDWLSAKELQELKDKIQAFEDSRNLKDEQVKNNDGKTI